MVDVDRRFPASHAAGLRRLSSRASTTSTSTTRIAGLHSFANLASSLVARLESANVPLTRGLSESELLRIESHFNFSFPPDLRALLSLALPSSPGFPRWRSASPLGPSPSSPPLGHHHHRKCRSFPRSGLQRAPLLIPIFTRCYVPCRPSLAGNPVFYVDDDRISCCALDLQDFISRITTAYSSPSPSPAGSSDGGRRVPRWIEFWSDAAASSDRRRRRSSSSPDAGPDPERYVEIRPAKVAPEWMERYMEEMGALLKGGGWGEDEVEEMVRVSEGCRLDCWGEEEEAVMDALVLRAGRWKEDLRAAGWDAEEVAELLNLEQLTCFDSGCVLGRGRENGVRKAVKLPPEIQLKVDGLAREFGMGR